MTGSGRRIDFLNPDKSQFFLLDIATSLSRNHRFGGHSPIKIGQHILEVMNLMLRDASFSSDLTEVQRSEIALVGLLHDFPEFAICDVPTPLKKLLGDAYADIEARLLAAMLERWNLAEAYERWGDLLHWADREAVQQEASRYRLDGLFIDEWGNESKVPNLWVPEDKDINLKSEILEESDVYYGVSRAFVKHMVLSGRWSLLTDAQRADAGGSVEAARDLFARYPTLSESLFTDHEGFN
jgi:hypothetical protein